MLKTKIVAQRLGNKPMGVVLNMVRNEKGEIAKDEVSRMMELPVYAVVPYDDAVRHSFVNDKVLPVMIRSPNAKACIEIQRLAARLAGLPVKSETKKSGKGFFAKIGDFFSRLFGGKKSEKMEELKV